MSNGQCVGNALVEAPDGAELGLMICGIGASIAQHRGPSIRYCECKLRPTAPGKSKYSHRTPCTLLVSRIASAIRSRMTRDRPVKLDNTTPAPGTLVRCSVPPLLPLFWLTNQTPRYWRRVSLSSTMQQVVQAINESAISAVSRFI